MSETNFGVSRCAARWRRHPRGTFDLSQDLQFSRERLRPARHLLYLHLKFYWDPSRNRSYNCSIVRGNPATLRPGCFNRVTPFRDENVCSRSSHRERLDRTNVFYCSINARVSPVYRTNATPPQYPNNLCSTDKIVERPRVLARFVLFLIEKERKKHCKRTHRG